MRRERAEEGDYQGRTADGNKPVCGDSVYPVSANSSRPISQRRISLVPAPIS